MKHELETYNCYFHGCGESVQASPETRPAKATMTCPAHRRILSWLMSRPINERRQLGALQRLLDAGHSEMTSEGWVRQKPLAAPPKPTALVQDSGEPTYVDWRPDLFFKDDNDGE